MGSQSNIEWTDATWNPIVGCSIVSPGCTNCYAMNWAAKRLDQPHDQFPHYRGTTKKVNGKFVWTGKIDKAPEHIWLAPLKRKIPTTYFVNSMGDLFHADVPDEWIDRVFATMALCPQHTFQVLTKRSKRMLNYFGDVESQTRRSIVNNLCFGISGWMGGKFTDEQCHIRKWPLQNVWLGVSCEDQQRADERIPDLLATPAAVRFVSAEPLLGLIDFNMIPTGAKFKEHIICESALHGPPDMQEGWPPLDWVICGGESGQGLRPMLMEWAECIMYQCKQAGTAFFFKQDSGAQPGQRGRASDELWACKEFPK